MVKYEPPWSIRKMKSGKFVVLEQDKPSLVVLDGLTKAQAERLVDYLVKQLDDQAKVKMMARDSSAGRLE